MVHSRFGQYTDTDKALCSVLVSYMFVADEPVWLEVYPPFLHGEVKNTKFISVTNEVVSDAHFVTIGFLCEDFEGEPQVMEPDEITKWEWFDLNDLPEPMFFPCVKIIKNYNDGEILKH